MPRARRPALPLVLAVDVGTSSCRARLYDARGNPLPGAHAQRSYTVRTTAAGGAELDARDLLEQVAQCLDEVSAGPHAASVAAVALTTFWHGLLGLDEFGQPATPLLTWLDTRARAEAVALRECLDESAVHARTGCVLHATYWPAKLSWLERHQPIDTARVHRWASFGDYLLQQWTGAIETSLSMASGTGLLDQRTLAWDDALLDTLQLQTAALPPVASSLRVGASLRPTLADRWPTLRQAEWLPALGDGALSNVGAGCTAPDRLALMVGTSGALRVLWRGTLDSGPPPGIWLYRLDADRPVLGGALNDGGSLVSWLRRAIRFPPGQLSDIVAVVPAGAHGVTVLPFWGGERSPGWSDNATGAILGLRLHSDPADLLRASLEGVALRFRVLADLLQPAAPESAEVVATGGALLHNPAWLQIMADVLDRPVLRSAVAEASSRGAALVALESLDLLDTPLESLPPLVAARYHPNPANVAFYQDLATHHRRLYQSLIK